MITAKDAKDAKIFLTYERHYLQIRRLLEGR